MKAFNLFFCFLFILFAGLQYNDPDPYLWIPIYLYAAVLCWMAFKGKFYPAAYIIGMIGYLGYGVFLFFTNNGVEDWVTKHHAENIAATMQAEKPWIEDTREFFGLLILITVLLINYFYAKKSLKKIKIQEA
jgi:Ca2+/Na+ antiporter